MATLLPALVTGLVLASSPAVRYSSAFRAETFVRTPGLAERADRSVLEDVVLTPRGQAILYTPRLELKGILEPQFMIRRTLSQPTLEVLTFFFLRGEYQLRRGLKVWAMESATYGTFPFEDFRVPAPVGDGGNRLLDANRYIYAETMAGFDLTSLRRTYIGAYVAYVINGLLDPPTTIRTRSETDRVTPAQYSVEVRAQAFHSFTRRFVMGLHLYGRSVDFSTGSHLSLLQATHVTQYQFHPLIQGKLEAGVAVGERLPQREEFSGLNPFLFHPMGEASLTVPVPVGYHWPVQAKLSARYLPFIGPFTTIVYPRLEESFGLEWKGRRQAQVNLEFALAQSVTQGFHKDDGEERVTLKIQWPLTRTSAVVASGRLLRLREFLISDDPLYKWFAGIELVIRQENGRL
ncbi:hypothetical protein [Stigmatella aurantiaca]|uniref:Conserved uncharacterized protein n=1 Tax=Stigmatella aurantiaca (strain DW4/3-1) TaxID=378806 RepID=E3FNG7_STIAD|nr:hypothetical protein [Stigmatella aurantiaca]ADO75640.1 conserved uncharacterized protein [Stigmatella aurantiaca DW4/3-1]